MARRRVTAAQLARVQKELGNKYLTADDVRAALDGTAEAGDGELAEMIAELRAKRRRTPIDRDQLDYMRIAVAARRAVG